MAYRKYDPMIKRMVVESGNRNLFPELNIPRTTINYWLKESKSKDSYPKNHIYEEALKKERKEVYELKAQNLLLHGCLKKVLLTNNFDVKNKESRKFVVEIVEEFKSLIPIRQILRIINISPSNYYRWKTEVLGCTFQTSNKCTVTRANQLTFEEQRLLIKLAKSKQFRKFSTISLMYYCKRKGILNCSVQTWYRYLKLNGIKRKTYINKRKNYKKGFRANDYWHIDITEVRYGENEKAYMQLVVDNFSRMIVGWKLSKNKTMKVTYLTLLKSLHFQPEFKGKIVCDSGRENIGSLPRKLILGRGLKQVIAKHDVWFSNSMVEAVFRQFKQKFFLKKPKTYRGLYQCIYKFVNQYNYEIPHSSLMGVTPAEKLSGICI
jgi:hypothetical protein